MNRQVIVLHSDKYGSNYTQTSKVTDKLEKLLERHETIVVTIEVADEEITSYE